MRTNTSVSFVLFFLFLPVSIVNAQDEKPEVSWGEILSNPGLRKELEITDDQHRAFEDGMKILRGDFKAKSNEVRVLWMESQSNPDLKEEFERTKAEYRVEYRQRMDQLISEIILPFQIERMEQVLSWRIAGESSGYAAFLLSGYMKKMLEIDHDQEKEMREKATKLQEEFEKELASLKEKYREKLKDELSRDQEKKLDEFLGNRPGLKRENARAKVHF